MVESPGRCSHRCGRVAWQGLKKKRRRVQWHCPRAPTPEPSKEGHRPKNRHSSKAKSVSALVSCLLPVFLAGSLPLRVPVCFWFRLMFLSAGRGRHVPAPGGRDVGSSWGTDPRAFTGIPLRTTLLCTSSRSCSFPALLFYSWWSWNCVPCILHCYNSAGLPIVQRQITRDFLEWIAVDLRRGHCFVAHK